MKDLRKLFKPEQFPPCESGHTSPHVCAQQILNQALDEATVVYKHISLPGWIGKEDTSLLYGVYGVYNNPTQKALLVCIEPLEKEPCKHEYNICQHCGVELVAEWKEKK